MLLPHLTAVTSLAKLLSTRAVVELHDNHRDAAWTNLMAVTRLVTAWDPEPVDFSQMVRYDCTATAYNLTWLALQAEGWGEERLAGLQREWEAVDLLKRLPETAAFSGASMVALCRAERKEPFHLQGIAMKDVILSPRFVWHTLADSWRRFRYRHRGTYEDERALMVYHQERELQLRRATQSADWIEMRQLPGVTNVVFFASKYPSAMQCVYNSKQLALAWRGIQSGGRLGCPYLGQAAEAEARRRLMVCAIALERYRDKHGSYPPDLLALVPELLPSPPLDFMNGEPLCYRLGRNGHFVLHSVGLDCVDNGGKLPSGGLSMRITSDTDLVWPRPGSEAEVERFHQEEVEAYSKLAARPEGTDPTTYEEK